ncbi:MAG: hypothetical protein J6U63_05810, partial [Clostridia bacterium]|nr:hypothetical protein [Clostridia bacterium]
MDNSYLYGKTGVQLKQIAKQEGIKIPSGAAKARNIELIIAAREEKESREAALQPEAEQAKEAQTAKPEQTAENAGAVPAGESAGETKAQEEQPAPEAPAPRKRSRSRKQPKPEEAPASEKAEALVPEEVQEPSAAQE